MLVIAVAKKGSKAPAQLVKLGTQKKSEAQRLKDIRQSAFNKGARMAARAQAKADGYAAGMKSAKKAKKAK